MKRTKDIIILFTCMIVGFLLARMDTQPHWNDSGITAMSVLVSSFLFGMLQPSQALLSALIIGGFVFFFNAFYAHTYGSVIVLVFSFAGAYAGVVAKNVTRKFS